MNDHRRVCCIEKSLAALSSIFLVEFANELDRLGVSPYLIFLEDKVFNRYPAVIQRLLGRRIGVITGSPRIELRTWSLINEGKTSLAVC